MKKTLLFLTALLAGISYASAQEKKTTRNAVPQCAESGLSSWFFPCAANARPEGESSKVKKGRIGESQVAPAVKVPPLAMQVSPTLVPKPVPRKPIAVSLPKTRLPDVVISIMSSGDDPLYLTSDQVEETVAVLKICAAQTPQGRKAECAEVPLGSERVSFSFSPSCIDIALCTKALVTQKWCKLHKGEWNIVENNFLCDALLP